MSDNHVSGSLSIFEFMKILQMFLATMLSHRVLLAWMLQMEYTHLSHVAISQHLIHWF